jgi:hypothetical protein
MEARALPGSRPQNLMKTTCAFGLALGATLLASPAFAAHPHLLFTAADVPALQQAATTTHAAIAQPFLSGVQGMLGASPPGPSTYGDPREAPDMLLPLAMAAVLQPDAAHLTTATSHLDTIVGWSDWQYGQGIDLAQSHFVMSVALAYDWLYPSLSSSERSTIAARLTSECDALNNAITGGIWWATEYTQNHNWANTSALGVCALALEGDVPAAKTSAWLATTTNDLTMVTSILNTIGDGSWHEGPGYLAAGLARLLPFLEMLRQVKGQDLTDLGLLRSLGKYRTANLIPSAPRTYLIDSGDTFGWSGEVELVWSAYAARRFHDPIAQAFAQSWINAGALNSFVPDISPEVFAFLLYDPTVTAVDLRDMPLDQRFDDQQATVFRSDRTTTPLLVALKTGPYTGEASFKRLIGQATGPTGNLNIGHDHADDNGFYLYANGQPLVPEASGYNAGVNNGHPPAQQSRYHNTLLIDGAGQLGEARTTDWYQGYAWANQRSGGIQKGGSTTDYAFVSGDGAHLYDPSTGLTRFDRQVLMVNRSYAVVRDAIDASSSHTFTQAWHFLDGASSSNGWIEGVAKNGAEVGVRVVEPAGYGFATSNLTPDNVQHLDPDGVIVEADVSTAPTQSARMLSVFWPTTHAAWGSKPTIDPISATPGAGFVLTSGSHVDKVLLHDDANAHTTEGDLEVAGLGGAVSLEGGVLQHALLLDGTKLVHAGNTLLEVPASATVEVAMAGTTLLVTGEGINVLKAFAPGATQVLVNGHLQPFAMQGETVVMPPPGIVPASAANLPDAAHPIWRVFDQPSNVVWSGTGGWPTGSSTTGTTGTTATSSTTGTTGTTATSTTASSTTGTTATSSASATTGTTGTSATSTTASSTTGTTATSTTASSTTGTTATSTTASSTTGTTATSSTTGAAGTTSTSVTSSAGATSGTTSPATIGSSGATTGSTAGSTTGRSTTGTSGGPGVVSVPIKNAPGPTATKPPTVKGQGCSTAGMGMAPLGLVVLLFRRRRR